MGAKILIPIAILLISFSSAYASGAKMGLQYCKFPNPGCGLEDSFYLDAPWHASRNFPVYAIVNTGFDEKIRYIKIYDDQAKKLIAVKDLGAFTVKKSDQPYFFEFTVNAGQLQKNNYGEASLKAVFGARLGADYENEEGHVTVKIGEELPQIENWHAGDIHYHTNYSTNIVEFGAPFSAAKKAAKSIGLDFIAVTDHSFALDKGSWQQILKYSAENSDRSFVFIPGEEVSASNGNEKYRHFLAIGIENFIPGDEIEANGDTLTYSPAQLVHIVNSQAAAGYIAHPFYEDLFRGKWGEDEFNLNFTGMQAWNYGSFKKDPSELEQGIKKWQELLETGRKAFIGAGSDSHGDFQILGKARTYAYAKELSQQGILSALKSGNSFITDGPLIAAWINGATFGQEALVEEHTQPEIKIQFTSNSEFGKISSIEVWRSGDLADTLEPNSYSEGNYIWKDSFAAENTYYRFVAATEYGYTAYTNPIWTKTFAKPKKEIQKEPAPKKEGDKINKSAQFLPGLIAMPAIIIAPWFGQIDSIFSLSPAEIIEYYKTDEMRQIDRLLAGVSAKINRSEGESVFAQGYAQQGNLENPGNSDSAGKIYTTEQYGGDSFSKRISPSNTFYNPHSGLTLNNTRES